MDTKDLKKRAAFRRAVIIVAVANIVYFVIEFTAALHIGAVSLLADSVDFLEDAAVNLLIFFALLWKPQTRARVGMALAGLLLLPVVGAFYALWQKITSHAPPHAGLMSLVGFGALVVNGGCAYLLMSHRYRGSSLGRAAFLAARNDVAANLAIITAGGVTALYPSVWPDVAVGLGIAAINAGAARSVMKAARAETGDSAAAQG